MPVEYITTDGWLRSFFEADEDETVPNLGFKRRQAKFILVERGETVRPCRAPQRTVEIVDPSVEGTDESALAPAAIFGNEARSAMPAHVVKAAYFTVAATNQQGAFAAHVEGEVAACLGKV